MKTNDIDMLTFSYLDLSMEMLRNGNRIGENWNPIVMPSTTGQQL